MSNTQQQLLDGHKILPIKLVAPEEIEHLRSSTVDKRIVFSTEAAHQFHLAGILLEEENDRHAAETQRLNEIINALRSHVAPGDRESPTGDPKDPKTNVARIRAIVQARRAVAATA
jgi:hypothetical protein